MNHKEALKKYFGYDSFRTGQEEIIDTIVNGGNVLAVLPTGAGKSICYQIPALIAESFSIVISPLIALMKDQVDSLNKNGMIAGFINSTLDYAESENILSSIMNKKLKLLYVSPEKLANKIFIERIKSMAPTYIFVDEAHCISEWGHNFRPSYRKIREFIEFCEIKRVSAFTATATEEVREDIINQLGVENFKVFVRGFERENLSIAAINTKHKKEKTLELIHTNKLPAIIYTSTRKNAEEVAEYLKLHKQNAVYYHAGLRSELKRIIQDDFISGRVKIIAATNAFGMGIDKKDIRAVIHYNMPGTIENYYQEIGRAGRDGNPSNTILLYDERDRDIQEYFIDSSFPSREQIEMVYDAVCDYGKVALGQKNDKEIPVDQQLKSLFDLKQISNALMESSIKILVESGYLSYNNLERKATVQYLLKPNQLRAFVDKFANQEDKDLLIILAREYGASIFKSKTSIDSSKICGILGIDQNELSSSLQLLSNGGIIDYKEPLSANSLQLTKTRIRSAQLVLHLDQMEKLKKRMHNKLKKMIQFTRTSDCRFNYILNYFGQLNNNYKCGKCDICKSEARTETSVTNYLEEIILQTLHESTTPIKEKNLIQILTGKTRNDSLKKFSTFGSCAHFSRNELEDGLESLVRNKRAVCLNETYSLADQGISFFTNLELQQAGDKSFEDELMLFNSLRQIRKEASDKFGQSPQLICPDEILRKIAKSKPKSHSELLSVDGFTQRMFNKIGEEFLSVIQSQDRDKLGRTNNSRKNLPSAIKQIYDLIQKKYSLEDVANLCRLSEQLTALQIESLIHQLPSLDITSLIDKNTFSLVEKKINDGINDLKELRESLGSKISYAKLRIILAKKKVS